MNIATVVRRFLLPRFAVTVLYGIRYKCFVSPRAEVEYTGNIKIGRHTRISSFTKIMATDGPLEIGKKVSISAGVAISTCNAGIVIGDRVLVSPNVAIIGGNYQYDRIDLPLYEQGRTSKGIRIGNNVWIGSNCAILDGAQIGDDVIVAPSSVVSTEVPKNCIVQGNPAKVVFERR